MFTENSIGHVYLVVWCNKESVSCIQCVTSLSSTLEAPALVSAIFLKRLNTMRMIGDVGTRMRCRSAQCWRWS